MARREPIKPEKTDVLLVMEDLIDPELTIKTKPSNKLCAYYWMMQKDNPDEFHKLLRNAQEQYSSLLAGYNRDKFAYDKDVANEKKSKKESDPGSAKCIAIAKQLLEDLNGST